MSAFEGALKGSTQHFISDAGDGVDERWSKICSRFQCGGPGGVVEPLAVRIRSSTEWLGNAMNGSRETLGFETRAERDLMPVLHRPIEPTTPQSGHSVLEVVATQTYGRWLLLCAAGVPAADSARSTYLSSPCISLFGLVLTSRDEPF